MLESEEQKAERLAAERRYQIQLLAAAALPGLIAHYKPVEVSDAGREAGEDLPVAQLSAAQIGEIAIASYEIASAVLDAIKIGEEAQAEAAV